MSSHHVIRENQEPAVLVQDFSALDLESFGQLLEWSPTVVTNEDSVDILLAEGIKVDILFADHELPPLQEHTKVVPQEGDFLEVALRYLIDHNHKAVNILSSYIPTNIGLLAKDINIVLFFQSKRFVFVRHTYEKWKPKGEFVYIDESLVKSFQGLAHNSKDTFVTTNDGFIQLEFNTEEFVLIGEDI